ncbi:MAG: hypothetical protein PWP27_1765, partial [Clostridiales bacterium]|nr:hypothetical protein [Clostridiales bacterium]MDK2933955.1 hypothetical protein [Clostridiales bacterium]
MCLSAQKAKVDCLDITLRFIITQAAPVLLIFHLNLHSAATAGGTNSNEKIVCGFHYFDIIIL